MLQNKPPGPSAMHGMTDGNNVRRRDRLTEARSLKYVASTVLAQDHFYSDFLSLSLTILTHKGSMRMIIICCVLESALALATGGMNNHTADCLNGSSFVMTYFHGQ